MDGSTLTEGLIGVVIGLALGILANAFLIWFIANHMIDLGDKIPLKKCIVCAFSLSLVQVAVYGCLILVPIPVVNLALALIVWYKGSVAVIEGSLEATKGGFTILFICTAVSLGLSVWQKAVMAG